MRNFKVPKSMVQKTLAGMLVGESAYTVPWALHVANDRSATLDVDMPAHTQPGGTVSMYVTRVGDKKWTVDLSKVPNDYVFTTSPHKSEHQVVENSEHIESVTVTLPRDFASDANMALRTAASHARKFGYYATADTLDTLVDALDGGRD